MYLASKYHMKLQVQVLVQFVSLKRLLLSIHPSLCTVSWGHLFQETHDMQYAWIITASLGNHDAPGACVTIDLWCNAYLCLRCGEHSDYGTIYLWCNAYLCLRCGEHSDYGTITLLFQVNKPGTRAIRDARALGGYLEGEHIEHSLVFGERILKTITQLNN